MTNNQAINIITRCAKQYQRHLENYQVVFVYRDECNRSVYTAVRFHSHNFLHFTGVLPRPDVNANFRPIEVTFLYFPDHNKQNSI